MSSSKLLRRIIEDAIRANGVHVDAPVLERIWSLVEDQLGFVDVAQDQRHLDGRVKEPWLVEEARHLDHRIAEYAGYEHLSPCVKRAEFDRQGPYYSVRRTLSFVTFKGRNA